jgi:ubiquinone/menaquinone biosynthesis C-methylase UbiE
MAEFVHLPFRDEQFEAVVFNASFHYAEDYQAAFREELRCVKSAGLVIVSDTPRYPREGSAGRLESHPRSFPGNADRTARNFTASLEYLTDEHLRAMEERLSLRRIIHSRHYGFLWLLRTLAAKFRNRREPSRFRIYVIRKP